MIKPSVNQKLAKGNILSVLASVCNPLSFISAAHLTRKILCREICDLKIPWDEIVPETIKHLWQLAIQNKIEIPRPVLLKQEQITATDLLVFKETSIADHCVVVYVVVQPPSTHRRIFT